MPFVYSTATCSGSYVKYAPDNGGNSGHAKVIKSVTINGGHGVANKALITPKGVVTEVTDEELEFLLADSAFQRHMKAGFMSVDNARIDPEKKAVNMAAGDNSAPLTPEDFKEGSGDVEARMYKGKSKK